MNILFDATDYPSPAPAGFGNIESDITVNSLYYMLDGEPHIFVAGEFHFERFPREFWEDEILKLKAGGIDVISAYITWLFHEPKKGSYCFDGDFDDAYFLSLCKKHGMRVIMRIGPYVHGELRHGGLPDFVFRLPYNRSDNPKYLDLVRGYWTRLYEHTREYYDGKTVLGIQLENEYVKGFEHLLTLRRLAEEIGFRVPVFTVTGWGFTFDSNELQGTYGGYPARPWAQHRRKMPVQGNFTIRNGYHDYTEIGEDTIDYSKAGKPEKAAEQPNMTCECGCGNQVTEHRREIISTDDAFGVPFATVANGCNFLGYYMYHGSNNPRGGLYQESRITLSPNNCPIIDYDFQAPLSRFGYPRESYRKLKNLNLFLQYYGYLLAPMRKYYSDDLPITEETDASTPRMSVRLDENKSGFVFISTYEREQKMPDLTNVNITIKSLSGDIVLPSLSVKSGSFVFYPFNITLGSKKYDYIIASPVAFIIKNGITTHYFKAAARLQPNYKSGGKESCFKVSDTPELIYNTIDKSTRLVVMSEEFADNFYLADGREIFTDGIVMGGEKLTVEYKKGSFCVVDGDRLQLPAPDIKTAVCLSRSQRFFAKYSRYLFSRGRKEYYTLKTRELDLSGNIADIVIHFGFEGTALQMYSDGELVNDFFNIEGKHSVSLKYFRKELEDGRELKIITAPFTRGHKVYTEKVFETDNAALSLKGCTVYYKTTL